MIFSYALHYLPHHSLSFAILVSLIYILTHLALFLTGLMSRCLEDNNLGRWGELMQVAIPFLPYDKHPSVAAARRLSRVASWNVGVPPDHYAIYIAVHISMMCVYIGKTTLDLLQRLRKHQTDAFAHVDTCLVHAILRKT